MALIHDTPPFLSPTDPRPHHARHDAPPSPPQTLSLSNNRLELLPDNVGDFPSLVRLDVSNNSMRFLPASMGNFRKIQRIDVSNNMLSR